MDALDSSILRSRTSWRFGTHWLRLATALLVVYVGVLSPQSAVAQLPHSETKTILPTGTKLADSPSGPLEDSSRRSGPVDASDSDAGVKGPSFSGSNWRDLFAMAWRRLPPGQHFGRS